ncbi:MAG: hypothetical protein ACW99Q_21570 [Candidatus Kariarchaeaceae archaeon]|jgi:hypothetical protein
MNKQFTLSSILLIIIIFFSGCTTDNQLTFEYTGFKDPVMVPNSTKTTVIFDFDLIVGSITLEVNPTATYLAYIENEVSIREGSDGSLEEAEEVSYSEMDSETMKIQFDSLKEGSLLGKHLDYSYDITIKVASNITMQIKLKTQLGEISISISDSSITISSLDLENIQGSISLTLASIQFSDSSPTIVTSDENQDITITNIVYLTSTIWSIYTSDSEGSVDLDLTDTKLPSNVSMTHKFNIDCSTGRISVIANLHQDIGFKIATSISTGDINIPGGGDSYTSANYISVIQHYVFDLSTSTGDITFSPGS